MRMAWATVLTLGAVLAGGCGDKKKETGGEQGDDTPQCAAGVCGDGVVCGDEPCDDGGESATCDADCTAVECGDGTTNITAGETCDDGGAADGDGCSASCQYEQSKSDWVTITGGTFMMGSMANSDELPVHEVTVPTFQMMIAEATVLEFQACVDAGGCTALAANASAGANWGANGRGNHPLNYVGWAQASAYCTWAGGRLPSEAEWEYAARSGGQVINYPWGDDSATCAHAVMNDGGNGCGRGRTWPVCSKSAGNSEHGLCDMAGNVSEWIQDLQHSSYDGAPTDGSAWEAGDGSKRVMRGGNFGHDADSLFASLRGGVEPDSARVNLGFRCSRPEI